MACRKLEWVGQSWASLLRLSNGPYPRCGRIADEIWTVLVHTTAAIRCSGGTVKEIGFSWRMLCIGWQPLTSIKGCDRPYLLELWSSIFLNASLLLFYQDFTTSFVPAKMSLPTGAAPPSSLGYHRVLGHNASIKVSPICLGTMNFGTAWWVEHAHRSWTTCWAALQGRVDGQMW
jgi:hypothetical protein